MNRLIDRLMSLISVLIIIGFIIVGIVTCFNCAPISTICVVMFVAIRREVLKNRKDE